MDPHFSEYCSPLPFRAFLRRSSPGLSVEQLPKIDAVLRSHSHYDHLDRKSLKSIKRQERGGTEIALICPSGAASLLHRWGNRAVTEMLWGETGDFYGNRDTAEAVDDPVRVTCLPAQHGAARTPFDVDKTLWCAWLLEYRDLKVAFREIPVTLLSSRGWENDLVHWTSPSSRLVLTNRGGLCNRCT